ncbi:MAG: TonB-dependent receptor [Bacteroidia bacterium]|nr:TonB-dependent receptor [Bacteroidia bacterium]
MNAIYKLLIAAILQLTVSVAAYSQTVLGTIYEANENNEKVFLPGVNIYWQGTTTGTVSDANGRFILSKKGINTTKLIVSLLGYKTDTIDLKKELTKIDIKMKQANIILNEVEVKGKLDDSYVSKISSRKVQVLTVGELQRAACCNLSESFETNASVDVTYSDAVTGAKQIQLLGLSGIYSQIQTENIPSIRGLASAYGLNYIPGSWMESIQISKGTSSVINGHESITGQINVEYKKPATTDKLFVNLYGNSNGRTEANINGAYKITDKLSTLLMVHGDYFDNKINKIDSTTINKVDNNLNLILDGNGNTIKINKTENFMDLPKLNTINIFNRWDYINPGKYVSRFGIKYLEENRNGGTMDFDKKTFVPDTSKINKMSLPYGFGLNTKRTEAFWKNGIMFPDKPWRSLGLILSGMNHEQTGFFGINNYHGYEKSFYANLIYQSIISNTNHKFSTGISYLYDNYKEGYDQIRFIYRYQDPNLGHPVTMADVVTLSPLTNLTPYTYNWDRTESVPGAFFEYTYNYLDKFTFIAGVRADYHNKYGAFVTPRTNLRWQVNETTVIRASAGLGYRTANVIAENLSLLASQRILPNDSVYKSLGQEKAINYGVNFTKEFKLFRHKAEFDLDFYRTDFINQVIVDVDKDPTTAYVYNLDGKSFSNSFQVQLTVEPVDRFSILTAFRLNDAMQTTDGRLRPRVLLPQYKGLITVSYATKFEKWKFDITGQFNGPSRISPQDKMPDIVKRDYEKTPPYIIVNAQITKKFKHNVDVYLGGENLLNFTQKDPLTEPFIPYHTHFDTTMIWGPVIGRVIYAGLRYTIK